MEADMTNQDLFDRVAGRGSNLRAADADRERIAERLRKSHAEGRLDIDEFQERLERCYGAKTFGELRELVKDLPREEADLRRPSGWFGPSHRHPAPVAPVLIALIVLAAVSGHFFWLWIPLLFFSFYWRMSWRRSRWLAGPRRGPDQWL
jgi:hypothetical protein